MDGADRSVPDAAAPPRPSGRRGNGRARRGFGLHHLLFLAFTVIAAVPISVLAIWEGNAAFHNEISSVRERHLLVARNLTSTMSRYIQDVKAVFAMSFESGALVRPVSGMAQLLVELHVVHVCIVDPDGRIETVMEGLPNGVGPVIDPRKLELIKTVAATAKNGPVVSNLVKNRRGDPVLLLVKPLPDGRIGLGVLATDYLVSLQQAIAFGDNGHAVITDATGQVIAHPFKDWTAASRDISGVPVVAAMIRGEMGVGQFYSPAFKGDMIAGYAVVPETGWGVMVPQPISELRRRAGDVAEVATVIAVVSFAAAALMSWLLALYLTRPVRLVAATAEAVLNGNDEVAVPQFRGWVPREIRRLGQAFNTMLDGLRQRAAEARVALQQAESSNQAKTQFLANMSHEIRTPLNGVVGMIELMQLTELSSVQRHYAEQATHSSQALLRLIDDILDLSRIEVGRLELERVAFHLPSLLQDAQRLFAEQARDKGLRLDVSIADDLRVVLVGDPHRLLQVLSNLVANAIKFTQEGGVTLAVSRVPDPGARWLVRFEVADTGIGIPPDQHRIIFDAFTQADSSTTRRYGGTGLGLSIARKLVRMMGGDIVVHSAVGMGSTFTFTLALDLAPPGTAEPGHEQLGWPESKPREIGQGAAPEIRQGRTDEGRTDQGGMHQRGTDQAAAAPDPAGVTAADPFVPVARRDFEAALRQSGRDSVRILLVEDNPANMRVTRALLETLGCDVASAENGVRAVEEYRAGRFDLVLMDCQMPEMDGYEATRAIRRIERAEDRSTPIIALTAHAMAGSRELSLASGMDDQLTKPLTMAALMRMLLTWLTPANAPARDGAAGPARV